MESGGSGDPRPQGPPPTVGAPVGEPVGESQPAAAAPPAEEAETLARQRGWKPGGIGLAGIGGSFGGIGRLIPIITGVGLAASGS